MIASSIAPRNRNVYPPGLKRAAPACPDILHGWFPMTRARFLPLLFALSLVVLVSPARAACVNKYVGQKGGNRVTMTLLTGMLNFDDAKTLAADIDSGAHGPLLWVGPDGKTISKQLGALKVVRPMPVACEGKSSGVVMQAVFVSIRQPSGTVRIVFDPDLTIDFEAQD